MSKRKWLYVNLAGVEFEYNTRERNIYVIPNTVLWDAYESPSQTKIEIYNEWARWFMEHDGRCGISSHNCMQFTLLGYFWYDGYKYYAHITKAHNKIWLAPEEDQN